MKPHSALSPLRCAILPIVLMSFISCNKPPYKVDYNNLGGYVIGKETCHTDEAQDYWLLDFTVYPNAPKVGDTLTLNGITYTNVLKVKGLAPEARQLGMRVSIDYKVISSSKVITASCEVANPTTYSLKEMFIINQFEIR